jgi:hypothetical protein
MWDRIRLRTAVEKVYGRLTRLSLTMYECVGMIAYNHLTKMKIIVDLKEELTQQQIEMNRIKTMISEMEDCLHEESEWASSIHSLSKNINTFSNRHALSLDITQQLFTNEEKNSSDIWRTIHGEKVLLHESIYQLGKILKKNDITEIEEHENRAIELMREISTMIQKKEANELHK